LSIGDEVRDIAAARKAGIAIAAVTWGYNSRAALERAHPDYLVTRPAELLQLSDQFLTAAADPDQRIRARPDAD
jgi:phosphoglycolate phosphatase